MHTIMQHGAAIISGLTSLFTLEIGRLTMEDGGLKIGGRGQGSERKRQDGKGSKSICGVWCGRRKLGGSSAKKASVRSIKIFRMEDGDVIHW